MIIWDTGPLFAAADADDRDHARCVDLMRRTPGPLLMPAPVLTEVGYLLEREKSGYGHPLLASAGWHAGHRRCLTAAALMLVRIADPPGAAMTAPHARRLQILPRPACTPAAIRSVLAATADADVLRRYDHDLDAAFEQAREHGDLTPLVQTVRRWWFQADAWRDPGAQRQFLDRVDQYQADGPPLPEERMNRQEIRAQYGL